MLNGETQMTNILCAIGIILVTAGAAYASTCQTTCYGSGSTRYCNTYCTG
jgi:hypothetical protein